MKAFLPAAAIVLLAGVLPTKGAITVVTGGDAGEGFAPQPFTFAAVNYGSGAVAATVQGVSFTLSDSHLSLTSTQTIGSLNSNISLGGSTANDVAMRSLTGPMVYGEGANLTLTITGLNPSIFYQLDTLAGWQVNYSSNIMTASATGATTVSDTMSGGQKLADGNVYDFSQTLKPNAAGTIVVTYSSTNGFNDSSVSAFSVTTATAAAPEPTAGVIFGLGALVLGSTFRRRRETAWETVP